jgi:hypothetical protein
LRKRDALKIEKKIISQASTTDTSLLTASYLITLQIAKCKRPYSIGEELSKPCLEQDQIIQMTLKLWLNMIAEGNS